MLIGDVSNIDLASTRFNGRKVIGGTLEGPNGDMQRFNLAKYYYDTNDSTAATPAGNWLKKRFTYLMPSASTDSLSIPAGDGIGYGKVAANGQSKIMGWSECGLQVHVFKSPSEWR